MIKKFLISIFVALALFGTAMGQMVEQKIEILFNLDEYAVEPSAEVNAKSIEALEHIINRSNTDSLFTITSIQIDSYASPEGGEHYNKALTVRRAESIYRYLCNNLSVADSLITLVPHGVAWDMLRQMVSNSNMESRDKVLDIIDNVPAESWRRIKPTDRWQTLVDSRRKHLMDLEGGAPYRYMRQNFFHALRCGEVVTIGFKSQKQPLAQQYAELKPLGLNYAEEIIPSSLAATILPIQTAKIATTATTDDNKELKDNGITLALKSNLLYDAVTAVNIEVEVPINKRWSVAGEWIFPWWKIDNGTQSSSRSRLQMLQGNLMAKYWFGERASQPQLTGWFAGVYAGAGLYDFEYHKKGVQGEFFIAGGVAGGYAHAINKRGNLRMEYSVGVGYLKTDYRRYTAEYYGEDDWRAIRTSSGNYSWFGPTQAKVSLVWMLNGKAKRGGVR